MAAFAFLLDRLARALLVALAILTLAALMGRLHPLLDAIGNLRPQLAALTLLPVAWLLARRAWLTGAAGLALALACGLPLLPYIDPDAAPPTPQAAFVETGHRLRVLTANLRGEAVTPTALLALLDDSRADIALLTELSTAHEALLENSREGWPAQVVPETASRPARFNVRLISRLPLRRSEIHRPFGSAFPIIVARLCLDEAEESCLRIVGLHAARPLAAGGLRDRQFAFIGELAARIGDDHLVVMGDLNATPFAPAFADLLAAGGLRDSGRGHGLGGTWPTGVPLLSVAIDHVLVGKGVVVLDRWIGPDIGSDHLPVIVDLGLLRGRREE